MVEQTVSILALLDDRDIVKGLARIAQRLDDAEKKGDKSGKGISNAYKRATTIVKGLRTALLRLTRVVATPFTLLNRATTGILRRLTSLRTLVAGGLFFGLARNLATFQDGFQQVLTLVDETTVNVEELRRGVLQLSADSGQPLGTLNKALFDAVSAGVEAGKSLEFLNVAQRLARGGATTTASATKGLVSVLNAYGLQADRAAEVSDSLFQAMKFGITTIEALSSNFGKVAPIAAQAGVSFDEALAALSAITRVGLSTEEAATALRAFFTSIIKPSAEAQAKAAELGIEFNTLGLQSKGLVGFLKDIGDRTGLVTSEVAQLFPNVRALNGVLALASGGAENLTRALQNQENKLGSTNEAVRKVDRSLGASLRRTWQRFLVLVTEIGEALQPFLRRLTDGVGNAIERLRSSGLLDFFRRLGAAAEAGVAAIISVVQNGELLQFVANTVRAAIRVAIDVFVASLPLALTAVKFVGRQLGIALTEAVAGGARERLARALADSSLLGVALDLFGVPAKDLESLREAGEELAEIERRLERLREIDRRGTVTDLLGGLGDARNAREFQNTVQSGVAFIRAIEEAERERERAIERINQAPDVSEGLARKAQAEVEAAGEGFLGAVAELAERAAATLTSGLSDASRARFGEFFAAVRDLTGDAAFDAGEEAAREFNRAFRAQLGPIATVEILGGSGTSPADIFRTEFDRIRLLRIETDKLGVAVGEALARFDEPLTGVALEGRVNELRAQIARLAALDAFEGIRFDPETAEALDRARSEIAALREQIDALREPVGVEIEFGDARRELESTIDALRPVQTRAEQGAERVKRFRAEAVNFGQLAEVLLQRAGTDLDRLAERQARIVAQATRGGLLTTSEAVAADRAAFAEMTVSLDDLERRFAQFLEGKPEGARLPATFRELRFELDALRERRDEFATALPVELAEARLDRLRQAFSTITASHSLLQEKLARGVFPSDEEIEAEVAAIEALSLQIAEAAAQLAIFQQAAEAKGDTDRAEFFRRLGIEIETMRVRVKGLLDDLGKLGDGSFIGGAEEALISLGQRFGTMQALGRNLVNTLASAFQGLVRNIFRADQSWREFASNFLIQLGEMLVQFAFFRAITDGLGLLSGGASEAVSGGGGLFGGLFTPLRRNRGGMVPRRGARALDRLARAGAFVLQSHAAGREVHRFAAGTPLVPGPRVDADIVPALLTPGEGIIRREAVDHYSARIIDAINRMVLPRDDIQALLGPVRTGSRVVKRSFASGGVAAGAAAGDGPPSIGGGSRILPAVVASEDAVESFLAGGREGALQFFRDQAEDIRAALGLTGRDL